MARPIGRLRSVSPLPVPGGVRALLPWAWPLVTLTLGLVLTGLGLLAMTSPWSHERALEEARRAPIVDTVASLEDLPPGQRVLVQGVIAPGQTVRRFTTSRGERPFVIYRLERQAPADAMEHIWQALTPAPAATPPLILDGCQLDLPPTCLTLEVTGEEQLPHQQCHPSSPRAVEPREGR